LIWRIRRRLGRKSGEESESLQASVEEEEEKGKGDAMTTDGSKGGSTGRASRSDD